MSALPKPTTPSAPIAFTRRGACPALSAPMKTGDGLLVRLNPLSGGLSPNALIGLCESARRHGNGIVEVTARGSFQIRGLKHTSAGSLAAEVDALGIAVRTGVPVETSPLAGLDPLEIADPRPLAEAIRNGIAERGLDGRLGAKVSVVIDGGGHSELAEVAADVRLTALGVDLWSVAIAGDATTARPLAVLPESGAKGFALSLLESIAKIGRQARARDLNDKVLVEVAFVAGRPEGGAKERKLSLFTLIHLTDSRIALPLALAFGAVENGTLIALMQSAKQSGIKEFRLAPGRRLLALCPSKQAADALAETAVDLGFITSADDARANIVACPGAPACASAYLPARAFADKAATIFGDLLDRNEILHISGCAKGCARQAPAFLTIVGDEKGAGCVVGGTAKDEPRAYTAADDVLSGLARLADRLRNAGRADVARLAQAFGNERE